MNSRSLYAIAVGLTVMVLAYWLSPTDPGIQNLPPAQRAEILQTPPAMESREEILKGLDAGSPVALSQALVYLRRHEDVELAKALGHAFEKQGQADRAWLFFLRGLGETPGPEELLELARNRPSQASAEGLKWISEALVPHMKNLPEHQLREWKDLFLTANHPDLALPFLKRFFLRRPGTDTLQEWADAARIASDSQILRECLLLGYLNQADPALLQDLIAKIPLEEEVGLNLRKDAVLLEGKPDQARELLAYLGAYRPQEAREFLNLLEAEVNRLPAPADFEGEVPWIREVHFHFPLASSPRFLRAGCATKPAFCFGGTDRIEAENLAHWTFEFFADQPALVLEALQELSFSELTDQELAWMLKRSPEGLSSLPLAEEGLRRSPRLTEALVFADLVARHGDGSLLPEELLELSLHRSFRENEPAATLDLLGHLSEQNLLNATQTVSLALMAHAQNHPRALDYSRKALSVGSDFRVAYLVAESLKSEDPGAKELWSKACRLAEPATEKEWDMALRACQRAGLATEELHLFRRYVESKSRPSHLLFSWHASLLKRGDEVMIEAEISRMRTLEYHSLEHAQMWWEFFRQKDDFEGAGKVREQALSWALAKGVQRLPEWLDETGTSQKREEILEKEVLASLEPQPDPLNPPLWLETTLGDGLASPAEEPVFISVKELRAVSVTTSPESTTLPTFSVTSAKPLSGELVLELQKKDQAGESRIGVLVPFHGVQVGAGAYQFASEAMGYVRLRPMGHALLEYGDEWKYAEVGRNIQFIYRDQPLSGFGIAATENLKIQETAVRMNRQLSEQIRLEVELARRNIEDALGRNLEKSDHFEIVLDGRQERLLYGAAWQRNSADSMNRALTALPLGSYERGDVYLGYALPLAQGELRLLLGTSVSGSDWHGFRRAEFEGRGGLSLYYESSWEPRLRQREESLGMKLKRGF